jgi:glycosyltransferase involved in cell wall biosynthesis
MTPPVTVLMPVLNGMPYLPESLASMEAQTFENWSLLVWENGSTDGTVEELRRWIPARIPGRVVTGQPLSLAASTARLVETAQTEYIARMDADDVCVPERLAKQVAFMESHPEVVLLSSRMDLLDVEGNISRPNWFDRDGSDANVRWLLRWAMCVGHSTVLTRRSEVLAAGNYREYVREDYDLFLRMSQGRGEFFEYPEVLVYYRMHPSSFTADKGPHEPLNRQIFALHADRLFPGFSAEEAFHIRDAMLRDTREPVTLRDFRLHRNAAVAAARAAAKPDSYFVRSELFQRQRFELFRNYLLQRKLGRTAIALKRLLH